MRHAYAVIMAGGSGTRFWPLSRRAHPKQMLPLAGEAPMLADTVRRLAPAIPLERVLVVTGAHLMGSVRAALPGIPEENLLAEPVGRNTAPCIGWAASVVLDRDPEGLLAVLPADHHIGDEPAFRAVLLRALGAAARGGLVTVGIQPTGPETGYGYIERGEVEGADLYRVARFVEKPDRARAESFLEHGGFLWNSGMFFFSAARILEEIGLQLPELAAGLKAMIPERGEERVQEIFPTLPSISIDYGVMEKAEEVTVVLGAFGWSDLGSFGAAWELAEKDEAGNAAPEGAILLDAEGCYVRAPKGKQVALIGLRDLVVIDTGDALLIAPRARAQEVREVVAALEARGRDDLL